MGESTGGKALSNNQKRRQLEGANVISRPHSDDHRHEQCADRSAASFTTAPPNPDHQYSMFSAAA
jgi:hypothetical protein